MKTRNYGIDFLRMISMIMIVMLHTLGHGGILRSVSFLSVHYQIAWLLEVIAFGAVNTYAMISGFVSVDSHFKISNILILWLQVWPLKTCVKNSHISCQKFSVTISQFKYKNRGFHFPLFCHLF